MSDYKPPYVFSLEEKIYVNLMTYGSLFRDRYDVLIHLFFCCGNGYKWKKGELIELDNPVTISSIEERDNYIKKFHIEGVKEDIERILELEKVSIEEDVTYSNNRKKHLQFLRQTLEDPDIVNIMVAFDHASYDQRFENLSNSKKYIKSVHLSEYDMAYTIPKNVKPEYIEAIKETIKHIEDAQYIIDYPLLFEKVKKKVEKLSLSR